MILTLPCPNPDPARILNNAPLPPWTTQALREMELEAALGKEERLYCPYQDCSMLLARPEGAGEGQADEPSECVYCSRPFCAACGTTGWHKVCAPACPACPSRESLSTGWWMVDGGWCVYTRSIA